MNFRWTRSLVFAVIFFLLSFYQIYAQDFNQARLDYQTIYSKYREILLDYRSARSEYLTYGTLVSKDRAVLVTNQFLTTRQDLINAYLKMLAARIDNSQGPYLSTEQTKLITSQIAFQTEFHQSQLPTLKAASTLEDLVKISGQIDKNILEVTKIGYQTQGLVIDARLQEYNDTTVNLLGVTTEQVRRITKEALKDTTQIDRWLIDADQKYRLANQELVNSKAQLVTIKTSAELEKYRNTVKKSRQYLKETNTLLSEIVTNIKIQ